MKRWRSIPIDTAVRPEQARFRIAALALADAIDVHWDGVLVGDEINIVAVQAFIDDYQAAWSEWHRTEVELWSRADW